MKKLLFSLAAVMMLTACQNSPADLMPYESGVREVMSSNPHRVTLAQALQNAEKMFGDISEQKTRSASQHIVKSVDYMINKATRSANDVDTMLYLVNYTDGGFALLGADTRIPRVFAVSDEGSLAWNDTINNPGLGQWLSNVTNSIQRVIIPNPGIIIPGIGGAKEYVSEKCAPRLNHHVKKWGQGYDYNKYCVTSSGDRAVVGCGPLSVTMVLSYFKIPTSVDGVNIYWDKVFQGNITDGLLRLLAKVGDKNNLNAKYGILETSITIDSWRMQTTFRNMGYNTSASFSNFDFDNVKTHLGRTYKYVYDPSGAVDHTDYSIPGHPILITGSGSSGGHIWVIDGWIIYDVTANMDTSDPSIGDGPFYDNYVHCIWGWDGDNNGYYLVSSPLVLGGQPNIFDDDDSKQYPHQYTYTNYMRLFGKVEPK